jgi:hypothetical protein
MTFIIFYTSVKEFINDKSNFSNASKFTHGTNLNK